jgi:putative serine protease PepD
MKITAAIAAAALAAAIVFSACDDGGSSSASAGSVRTTASATALQAQTVGVVKRVSPSVVEMECGNRLGSGVVFDDQGDIVTNAHVVGGSGACNVMLSDESRHPADVIGRDTSHDIAVVHVADATPQPAGFADSSAVEVGDTVLAMGNPLGLQSSVTEGIVSSLDRKVPESRNVQLSALIQTSAEINPGNSGGALVDLSGRVIGIPTLTALDPEFGGNEAPGIGFAIPSNTVRTIASSLVGSG